MLERGPRRPRRGDRADHAHLPPVGRRRRPLRDRPRAQPAQRRRPRAARPPRRRRHLRDARRRPGRAPPPLRRAADAADRRRAAPHGRARLVGPQHRRPRSSAPASGCCCPARRSARTTRRSRGSTYDDDGVSSADYAYGYTEALIDGVCRPVTFHTYDGDMEWVSDGRRRRADFTVALPAAEAARRLRTALDPEGDWVGHVLADAHRELIDLRAGAHHDAGGLVIAADKEHAEKLADRLARIAGERPEIVTSDAPDASARIARFAAGTGTWLVSVLMVSEGVDVPRLRVGVYATSARTELFFRQVVGPLHPPHADAASIRCRTCSCPATRRSKRLAGADRGGAQPRARGQAGGRGDRARRARRGRATRSTRCPRAPAATTTSCARPRPATRCSCSPTPTPAPSPALAAFGGGSPPPRPRRRPPRRRRAPPARPPTSGASACARSAARSCSTVARRTGEEHRVDQRPHQPRRRRGVGREGDRRPAREGQQAARARGRALARPAWRGWARRPTGALASAPWTRCPSGPTARSRRSSRRATHPHAIPVSLIVRAGPREILLGLAPRRESLARLRADPRAALTILAAGDHAFTAHGRATVLRGGRRHRRRPDRGRRIADHNRPTYEIATACSGTGPTSDERERDAATRAALRALLAG